MTFLTARFLEVLRYGGNGKGENTTFVSLVESPKFSP